MWDRITSWLASFFRRSSSATPTIPVFEPHPKRERKQRVKVDDDTSQAHYYMGDLLEQLDNYFSDFDYLRRGNPDAAEIFEKYGVSVCSKERTLETALDTSFLAQMPAQGCFYFGRNNDDEDSVGLRFVYFQKHKRPINVQHTNHTTYEVGGVWGIEDRHCFQFYVSVDDAGIVRVLKQVRPAYHTVGKGGKKNGGYTRGHIIRMEWSYPSFLREWLVGHNAKHKENKTIDQFSAVIFSIMANGVQNTQFDMNVRVKKDGRVATFAINMLRTPYFFAERDKTKNENGNTKSILHIVRPHMRNGKAIKAHWRGERRFMWNGYEVSIGMPGKHFAALSDFTAAAWELIDMGEGKGVTLADAAKRIDEHLTVGRSNAA